MELAQLRRCLGIEWLVSWVVTYGICHVSDDIWDYVHLPTAPK